MTIDFSNEEFVLLLFFAQTTTDVMRKGIERGLANGKTTIPEQESMRNAIDLNNRLVQIGRDAGILVKPS